MSSIIEGYTYDIFISYRQKDNKHDGWVSEFFENLKDELESTFKEDIHLYFDINPHDALLETHDVNDSLKDKLKCLVFIPVISRTYCDPKSFAWEHEFKAFVNQASHDRFGLKVKLPNGNVANRVLPVKIHDLDNTDIKECESVLGGVLRGVEFIYKSIGVNRPLRPKEDKPLDNLNKTIYRDQINKVANAVKEIISALRKHDQQREEEVQIKMEKTSINNLPKKILVGSLILIILLIAGYFVIPGLAKPSVSMDKSVAVLPFVNLSRDPDQEYFSDGMVEAILDHLFKVGDLKVISSTSTKRYKKTKLPLKQIAKELGVGAILEGSVQKIGDSVRIFAQLIDAKKDVHIWAETYDKSLSDIFSVQSEVAQMVAKELKAKLTLNEAALIRKIGITTNQKAYDFYLRGINSWSEFDEKTAIDLFTHAIQEDSLFAAAYARRAQMHLFFYWKRDENGESHKTLAKEDINKGFELNPGLPEVKFAEAVGYYMFDRDFKKALKILDQLTEQAPGMADLYAYKSYILRRQGKPAESIVELKHAIDLDPLNTNYIYNLIQTYEFLHEYDIQLEWCRKGLALRPDDKKIRIQFYRAYLSKTGNLEVSVKNSWHNLNTDTIKEEISYYGREYEKNIGLLRLSKSKVDYQNDFRPYTYQLSLSCFLQGNKHLTRIYADSCISFLKKRLQSAPYDERLYATLGKCYALIGNNDKALECGNYMVKLMPVKRDAIAGIRTEQHLLEIYVLTGNIEMALDKLEFLLSRPSFLDVGVVLVDPIYDSLRGLPRFQLIINKAKKQWNID
jgi:TolB-like protein